MFVGDDVSLCTLSQLSHRLQSETAVPDSYNILLDDNHLVIYRLRTENGLSRDITSVTVNSGLTVVASVDGVIVPTSVLTDLVKGPIERISQLINLMARIKAHGEDSRSRSLQSVS